MLILFIKKYSYFGLRDSTVRQRLNTFKDYIIREYNNLDIKHTVYTINNKKLNNKSLSFFLETNEIPYTKYINNHIKYVKRMKKRDILLVMIEDGSITSSRYYESLRSSFIRKKRY